MECFADGMGHFLFSSKAPWISAWLAMIIVGCSGSSDGFFDEDSGASLGHKSTEIARSSAATSGVTDQSSAASRTSMRAPEVVETTFPGAGAGGAGGAGSADAGAASAPPTGGGGGGANANGCANGHPPSWADRCCGGTPCVGDECAHRCGECAGCSGAICCLRKGHKQGARCVSDADACSAPDDQGDDDGKGGGKGKGHD
jgi:hypothetical protein